MRGSAWGTIVGLLALAQMAHAGPGMRFAPYVPLTAEDLYASELRFRAGLPLVTLGLEEGRPTLELASDAPMRLMFEEAGLPKTVFVDGGGLELSLERAAAGRRSWWVRVAEAPSLAAAQAEARAWSKRPWPVRLERVGGIMGVQGVLLDTRAHEVLVGGLFDEESAEALALRIYRAHGVRATVRPVLEQRGRGRIQIRRAGSGALVGVAQDVLQVDAPEGEHMSLGERELHGHVYAAVDLDGTLSLSISVDVETLLRGLVPAEIYASSPPAALDAQAIVARGAVLSMLAHRHFDAPFHLCDEQHCQVYQGAHATHPATDAAVARTVGQVAIRPPQPGAPIHLVDSVYSASCGGHTEANDVAWDQPASPSLRPRLDGPASDPALAPFAQGLNEKNIRAWVELSSPPSYCARASLARPDRVRWTKHLDRSELDVIGVQLGVGALTEIEVLGRGSGGRVTGVEVRGTEGTKRVLREYPVRKLFSNLRSGAFVLDVTRDAAGGIEALDFTGAGWGHGVGMCQLGAIGRAEAGHSAAQILSHYYSGATLVRLYGALR